MPVPSSDGVAARSRLRDDAFRLLRDAIIDGTLRPGERLNDAELVRWLQQYDEWSKDRRMT